jgi:hypothetical protein
MTIPPAPANPPTNPDVELRRAVAVAYRTVRQQGGLDYPARLAAEAAARALRPDLSEEEISARIARIICWAASEHTAWFWRDTGGE